MPADKWSTALLDSPETRVPRPDFVLLGTEPESVGHTHTNAEIQTHTHTRGHLLKLEGFPCSAGGAASTLSGHACCAAALIAQLEEKRKL